MDRTDKGANGFIVEKLTKLFDCNQRELAELLGVHEATVSRLRNDSDALGWSPENIRNAITALSRHQPPIVLEPQDWNLSKAEFFAKIDRQISPPQPSGGEGVPRARIELFHGRFIRLFIKPLQPRLDRLAVHLADFWILPKDAPGEARVELRSFDNDLKHANQRERQPFEHPTPIGYLKLIDNTLEMQVEYGRDLPNSLYLGPRLRAGRIEWFLMTNLDINYVDHEVSAQPMLFVRVGDQDAYPLTPVISGTRLFRAVKNLLSECTNYEDGHFELLLKERHASSIGPVLEAMHQLRDIHGQSQNTTE